VPLALFIFLAVLHYVPLPAHWVEHLSPSTMATKAELLGEGQELSWTSLSFYPLGTLDNLRLLLVGAVVFVTTVLTFQRPDQVKRLLAAMFLIGVAVAALALLQIATLADRIYWSVGRAGEGVVTAGPFVNHSNFSQFINLSIGSGLALLLVKLREEERHGPRHWWGHAGSDVGRSLGPGRGSFVPRPGRSAPHAWLTCGLVLSAVAVFTSLSRNGVISLTVSAMIIGTALYWRRVLSWRGWLLAVVPWGVLALLLMVGFDTLYERLATLQEEHDWAFRWEMTAGTLRAWRHFPIWGTGLGTHEFVFPMFDRAASTLVAFHADNEYAQLLEETGLVGASFLGTFLLVVGGHGLNLMRRGESSLSVASFGLAFGLIAVAIHSASDFGQHLPANFCLSAVACGLVVSLARQERQREVSKQALPPASHAPAPVCSEIPRRRMVIAGGISAAVLALVWAWTFPSAFAAYRGERNWDATLILEAPLLQQGWQGTDEQYVDLLRSATAAFESEPRNVKYGYWLNLYRWYSISREVDQETGQVLLHPAAIPIAERIADEFARVRELCPTYGPPYSVEGQLRLFVLGDPDGATLVRQGYKLASYDPVTCFVAGMLAVENGEAEAAARMLRRAVELQPSYFREVAVVLLFVLKRPALAQNLAGDDYGRLTDLVQMCEVDEAYAALAEKLQARAEGVLRKRAAASDATAQELSTLASIEQQQGALEEAAALYRRALHIDYGNVGLRLALAKVLSELGRHDEALYEARICLRLRPEHQPAKQLIEELSLL
jgi:O-antigen ligase